MHELARTRVGIAAALGAFLVWGLSPLYWKLLVGVSPLELTAHRIVWALVVVFAWLAVRRRLRSVRQVGADRAAVAALVGSTALIAVNWFVYIWAVTNDHILDASLGYYINPIVSVALGVVVLRERLTRAKQVAVLLAVAGVTVLTVWHGRFPWISLVLAITFGLYGLVRKTVRAEAAVGLLFETSILTPFALVFLTVLAVQGRGAFTPAAPGVDALLLLSGPITAIPLALFAVAARRLPLSTVGLLQYLSPTGQFLLAVFLYREPFRLANAVCFALIWAALAIFTVDLRHRLRELRTIEDLAEAQRPGV